MNNKIERTFDVMKLDNGAGLPSTIATRLTKEQSHDVLKELNGSRYFTYMARITPKEV